MQPTCFDGCMETGFPRGSTPTVDLRLWRSDAIVLFDWLMSTDLNAVPITHPAQKQAPAQEEVARDMGW
ncbi:hypothetical protein TUSST3_88370 [Streptomyces sp. TUS-ST3]|nr:hypothetical protein TUSST3_88370 [Streptomyces sp. TUS-ST3]